MKTIARLSLDNDSIDFDAWDYEFLLERKKKVIMGFIGIYMADPDVSYEVDFYEGVTLKYGGQYDDYVYATKHGIKKIFQLGGDMFYITGRMRKRGYELYYEFYADFKSITVYRR